MRASKILITIDGYASSGKSTLGKIIAEKIDGIFISTGEIYRLLTYWLIRYDINLNDEQAVIEKIQEFNLSSQINEEKQIEFLCYEKLIKKNLLYNERISSKVSFVAKIGKVRKNLINFQRNFIELGDRLVIEGRDISTVIFPNSDYKFFITAKLKIRAERRIKEYQEKFTKKELDELTKKILIRDKIDSTRKNSPTKQADNAILIDTSTKTIEKVVKEIIKVIS